jgi:O-antigen/teichoic acid export membrane protein
MALDPTHSRFGKLLGTLLMMTIILTLLGWMIAFFLYSSSSEGIFDGLPAAALLIGFLSLPFLIWEQYGSFLLMGLERVRIYNYYQIAGRTLSVMGLLMLVGWLGQGVSGVLQATLVGQIIVSLGGIGFLIKHTRRVNPSFLPDKTEIRTLLIGGAKLHMNNIGGFIIWSAGVLILNVYHGAEQAGYFQMAVQLLGALMIVPVSASMVIYGKVTKLGPNAAWPDNKRLLIQITLLMIVLGAIAAAFAPWVIALLAGELFRPAVEPFRLMLIGLIGMTFSTVMAPQWIGRGYFWQAASLTFLVGSVSLLINFWLIPIYGMYGAIYAFIGTYVFSVIGNGAMAWHCQKMSRERRCELH